MIVSVLDTQSPAHLPVLVPELERLGYHRYWATEHHSASQSASPTIVAGLAAGITERMRVGTAGVLLRAASALRVAEDFATLELFFSGRIDLGIAGALPSGAYADDMRADIAFASDDTYTARLRRLVDLVRSGRLSDGTSQVGPQIVSKPQLWLCGTSERAARVAGALGLSFAFHHYLASANQRPMAEVADAYREAFVSADGTAPRLAIAAYGHCADSDEQARSDWDSFFRSNIPQPSFLGTPTCVAEQLAELADGYAADELLIDCFAPSLEGRLEALSIVKDAVDRRFGAAPLDGASLH